MTKMTESMFDARPGTMEQQGGTKHQAMCVA